MPGIGFDDFVDEQLDDLLRYASVLTCDAELAQDVVREALMHARQRWQRIAATGEPGAQVRRMITTEYLSLNRRRAVRAAAVAPVGDAVLAGIAGLVPTQRAALVLRYYEDRADAEIAEVLGCGVDTVRRQLATALATLHVKEATASTGEAS